MRLTLRICKLPLLAGLVGPMIACSEGTTAANSETGGGGGAASTATDTGGTPSTDGSGGATSALGGSTSAMGGAASGVAGSTSVPVCFEFNNDTEGWLKSTYARVASVTDPAVDDPALSAALQAAWSADWMAGPGYGGTNGYIQLTIPYNATQNSWQSVLFALVTPAAPIQLKGKIVSAYVKHVSGLTPASSPSGAKLAIKTGGDYYYVDGGYNNLVLGQWWKISVDADVPANVDLVKDASLYDANDVREIDIQIDTSGQATTVETPGVVLIDHICYQ